MYSEEAILHSLQCMQSSGLPSLLMVTHALGGGVERHVQELQALLEGRAHVLTVRPHVHAQQVLLSAPIYAQANGAVRSQNELRLAFKWPQDSEQLRQWFTVLGLSRVHVHHVLGFAQSFWQMLDELQLPFDLTLHDHSIFTGNPSLLDDRGQFDPRWLDNGLSALPPGDERVARTLNSLALRAQRVIVPSQALADKLAKFFPSLEVLVRSHPERELGGPYPAVQPQSPAPQHSFKVLCLGMLGLEKGAYVLERTARLAAQQQLNLEFILLGACHVELPESVRCMGLYQDAELLALIADAAPHLLWLPAQCPETWSYTLSAGLRAGLPVLASDLGALPERLSGRPFTQLLAHTATAEQWLAAIQGLQAAIANSANSANTSTTRSPRYNWPQPPLARFYTAVKEPVDAKCAAASGQATDKTAGKKPAIEARAEFKAKPKTAANPVASSQYVLEQAANSPTSFAPETLPAGLAKARRLALKQGGRWRIWLLKIIYMASRWPWLARLLRYVPYRWQRRIKRAVSRAPLDKCIVSK